MKPERFKFGLPADFCTKDEFLRVRVPEFKSDAERRFDVTLDDGIYAEAEGNHTLTCHIKPAPESA